MAPLQLALSELEMSIQGHSDSKPYISDKTPT